MAMTDTMPSTRPGERAPLERVLARGQLGRQAVCIADFLAPTAGADEVGDRDAVDQDRHDRRPGPEQHVNRHPAAGRLKRGIGSGVLDAGLFQFGRGLLGERAAIRSAA